MSQMSYSLDRINHILKEYEKYMGTNSKPSRKSFCDSHNINVNTFKAWVRKHDHPTAKLCGTNGRPLYIDGKNLGKCRDAIVAEYNTFQKSSEQVTEMIVEAAKDTAFELHNSDKELIQLPTPKTIGRYKKKLEMFSRKGRKITSAREAACRDKRHAVSFAAMNDLMVGRSHESIICNMDSTVFTFNQPANRKATAEMIHPVRNVTLRATPNDLSNCLAFGIKWFALISASGHHASHVLIFQDKGMAADEIDVVQTNLLGSSSDAGIKGYIVFCKSRCCNVRFYEWYNNEILIPFIKTQRKEHAEAAERPAWFILDGERIQINGYFNEELLKRLENENITVGKLPASTTSITQPLDVGNCFLAAKTKFRKLKQGYLQSSYGGIIEKFKKIIKEHQLKYRSTTGKTDITPEHVTIGALSLAGIRLSLPVGLQPKSIHDSFSKTGIYPVNVISMLRQFHCHFQDGDKVSILSNLADFKNMLDKKGEISEDVFHKLLVERRIDDTGKRKDELAIDKQRGVILSNRNYNRKVNNKMVQKELSKTKAQASKAAREEAKAAKAACAEHARNAHGVPDGTCNDAAGAATPTDAAAAADEDDDDDMEMVCSGAPAYEEQSDKSTVANNNQQEGELKSQRIRSPRKRSIGNCNAVDNEISSGVDSNNQRAKRVKRGPSHISV